MNSEGIGMGLMICKNLVTINGGEINVHSDGVNKGSVFSFNMHMEIDEENLLEEEVKEGRDAAEGPNKVKKI